MPRSASTLPMAAGCAAAGHEDEDRFGVGVLGALHEGGKVGIGHGKAHRADDLPASCLEAAMERPFRIVAGAVVGHHGVGLPEPVLVGPGAERLDQLRYGGGGAHHVGRLGDDDGGRRIHHHHEFLGLRRNVGGGNRVGRQYEACEDVHPVARDELLGEALGDVGGDPAGVPTEELDLPARHGVALLLDEQLDGVVHLAGGVSELSRVGQNETDLDRVLRARRRCQHGCKSGARPPNGSQHGFLPVGSLAA
jgi:hypothetical protein